MERTDEIDHVRRVSSAPCSLLCLRERIRNLLDAVGRRDYRNRRAARDDQAWDTLIIRDGKDTPSAHSQLRLSGGK